MQQEIRRLAEERVERRINFFTHLVVFLIINTGLFFIWYFVSEHGKGFPWFLIILGGWGMGLVAHFFTVFVFARFREHLIDKEMNRIQQRKNKME